MAGIEQSRFLLLLADVLVPAAEGMPAFSTVCTPAEIAKCLSIRQDVVGDLQRALASESLGLDPYATLVRLASDDASAFIALGLIVVSAYYMSPRVRELIGYPGQESLPIRPGEADYYLRDGLLQPVISRGQRYVPTPAT